jgi:hypothetical protein
MSGFQMDGIKMAVLQNLEQVSNFMGGAFLIFVLIFLGILIFMTISNCVIYGIIISEDQNKDLKIDKGYAIFMLALNVIGLLVIIFLFFWILFKFKAYRGKIKETISNIIRTMQEAKACDLNLRKVTEANEKWVKAFSDRDYITKRYAELNNVPMGDLLS